MNATTRPPSGAADAVNAEGAARLTTRWLVLIGVAVSLVLAGIVSYYASGHPDGLQFVAHQLGFGDAAQAGHDAPLAGYSVKGVSDGRLSGGLAGVIGVVVTGAIAFAMTWALRRRGSRTSNPPGPHDSHGD